MDGIRIIKTVIGTLEDRERMLRIRLPHDYERNPTKRYPVLYMHDGQNLFDPSGYSGYSWDVANTLDRLETAGVIDGIIVVGIDNGGEHRIAECSHAYDPATIGRVRKHLQGVLPPAEGVTYAAWIANTVKPMIDAQYRTLPDPAHTAVAGSSCGGNISLYMALAHGDVFGIFGVFSPALWVVTRDTYAMIRTHDFRSARIYHDMGGKEDKVWLGSLMLSIITAKLQRALARRLPADRLLHVYDPRARHTELFWQDRFPGFVRWAFAHEDRR